MEKKIGPVEAAIAALFGTFFVGGIAILAGLLFTLPNKMYEYHEKKSEATIERMFSYDTNSDDKLNKIEAKNYIKNHLSYPPYPSEDYLLSNLLEKYDTNKDGDIAKSELESRLK